MKIRDEVISMLIAGFIWFIIYSSFVNITVDDKQDVFLADRPMYQKEIWLMQNKLDTIINILSDK